MAFLVSLDVGMGRDWIVSSELGGFLKSRVFFYGRLMNSNFKIWFSNVPEIP